MALFRTITKAHRPTVACRVASLVIIIVCAAGCTTATPPVEPSTQPALPGNPPPILKVTQGDYTFSMYPQYVDEGKSQLNLGVRDKQQNFVPTLTAIATLVAKDGHRKTAHFVVDLKRQKYVSQIVLKHHEEYEIETDLTLKNGAGHFSPKFLFHCCDPIPELMEQPEDKSEVH